MTKRASTLTLLLTFLVLPALAWAEEAAGGGAAGGGIGGLVALGAGLGVGLAALGGALGQGRVAGSALEGISRNPSASGQMFLPFILGVAFVESLVLLTFVIAYLLQGKIA
ncbi:MAG: ATP synthase F0 subunit C [Nitrospirae bacterium]|nr:ATP synthase F0 subunit C [Nitrospirota bacterium]